MNTFEIGDKELDLKIEEIVTDLCEIKKQIKATTQEEWLEFVKCENAKRNLKISLTTDGFKQEF